MNVKDKSFKAFFMAVSVLFVCFVFCGCSETIRDKGTELTCYSWQGENPNGSSFTLSFSDNYGEFQVFPAEKGTATKIYGDCIVTNSSFAIIDRESGEVVVFDYTLLGDTMELSYEGGVITLEKLMTTESSS